MKLSLGGFSFYQLLSAGKMDIFGYLETAAHRYRLQSVDLWNGFMTDRSDPFYPVADTALLMRIRNSMEEKGLTLANFAVDRAHLWDEDADVREKLHRNAMDYLRAAELLGARTVRIDTSRGPVQPTEAQFEYTVKRYQEYAQRAADYGYTVGPENHTGISLHAGWMKQLAEAVGHPGYGILLHIGRWQEGTEPGERLLAPWVNHVHLDARSIVAEETPPIINHLLDSGYAGAWAVEYNAPEHPFIELEWALASVKRLLVRTNAAGRERGIGGQQHAAN